MIQIPYPSVFRDWQHPERRVATATSQGTGGVRVETLLPGARSTWISVELTEDGASLLAASLLMRAGHEKLARRVLRKLDRAAAKRDAAKRSS